MGVPITSRDIFWLAVGAGVGAAAARRLIALICDASDELSSNAPRMARLNDGDEVGVFVPPLPQLVCEMLGASKLCYLATVESGTPVRYPVIKLADVLPGTQAKQQS